MLECVWCKNKEGQGWSKHREPLCSECEHKYLFGKEQGLINGAVSRLTKEQRRDISYKLHKIECFVRAMRYVNKETLGKRASILFKVVVLIVSISLLIIWFSFFASGFDKGFFPSLIAGLSFMLIGLVDFWILNKIAWFFQFFQLRKKAKNAGYSDLWNNYDIS